LESKKRTKKRKFSYSAARRALKLCPCRVYNQMGRLMH
jgi:hypothetical protein